MPFNDRIKLEQINFAHDEALEALFTDLTLEIPKGTYLGLVGQSGAGKSTLIDIITGLLKPNTGVVTVDGIDIHSNLSNWQNQIGYVAQSINLMDDTIRNNIAFGIADVDVSENLLKQAINGAQLQEFINGLPLSVETIVGERGVRLSGGQRQRIGIARALYHNPSVLIFDEATNFLDVKTEEGILQTINLLKKEKTIIFITHKKLLLNNCDVIYELSGGKLGVVKYPF